MSSGLPFHMLFSSQLLGLTKVISSLLPIFASLLIMEKPDPAIYNKALELMQLKSGECIMVAAHAYDLRAAKGV